jgi:hypothetical protein
VASGLSPGVKIGIVVAAVVVLIAIIGGLLLWRKRRQGGTNPGSNEALVTSDNADTGDDEESGRRIGRESGMSLSDLTLPRSEGIKDYDRGSEPGLSPTP